MQDATNTPKNEDIQKSSVTLDDLAVMVKEGFDDVHKEITIIKQDLKGMATKEDLKGMATKEDLSREIGKLRSDMIDYIAKQNLELKTDLVIIMKGEDKKLFSLIELMVERKLITKDDANRVTRLEPFPQTV